MAIEWYLMTASSYVVFLVKESWLIILVIFLLNNESFF